MKRFVWLGIVASIMLAAGAIGAWWFLQAPRQAMAQSVPVDVTIFIHGTVGTEFNVFSPFHCLSDTASEQTLSTRLSRKFRSHPYLQHDQLLGPEGMIEVPYSKLQYYRYDMTQEVDTQNAWYHIISAYDAVAQHVGMTQAHRHYLLYGWNGLLSNRARKRAGYDLYHSLRTIYARVKRMYNRAPRIRIIAHSHGGNVALWAAQAAIEDEANFSIDMLFMMGTPIQQETIDYIRHPFYKTIISTYSLGDSIQPNDYFSTSYHRSYQRMADLTNLEPAVKEAGGVRADMQYLVNLQNDTVTHANMWLMGRNKPVFSFVEPLPLVIFAPAFFARVGQHAAYTQYQAHLHGANGYCVSQVVGSEGPMRSIVYRSPNLYPTLKAERDRVMETWNPVDDSRRLVFNYKNFSAMRHAFGV